MDNIKTIIAAMSGGVDSSVAAAIYKEKGYRVIGVTLQMKDKDDEKEEIKSCCGPDEKTRARMVCEQLGIEHHYVSARKDFAEKVLQYTWNEYCIGRTPNPCVMCNHFIKFGPVMQELLKQFNACGIITGHYAVIDRSDPNKARLFKGDNKAKDQTYFLSALTQEQLNLCHMPLGNIDKEEVRKIAESLNLPTAHSKESQDTCFGYKDEIFAETLARYFKQTPVTGNMLDDTGKVIGIHKGIQYYTIGQRKKLGVALGAPAYVTDIDKEKNQIVISTDPQKLMSSVFYASDMNWLDFDSDSLECEIMTRYRQPLQAAVVYKEGNFARVELKEPLASVTPGQRLAVFKDNQLLAGGWIMKGNKK